MSQIEILQRLLESQVEQNLQLQKINASQAESLEKLTKQVNELLSRIARLNHQPTIRFGSADDH